VFAQGPGGLGVIDFRWSDYGLAAWCARRHAGDARRRTDCAAPRAPGPESHGQRIARLAGARLLPQALALEGGGVEVDGQGLMIACEALLVSRNPGWTRRQLELALLALPGVRRVIWLPEGLAQDVHLRATIIGDHVGWGTGGHTDEFVRFADERTVLLAWQDGGDRHPVSRLNRLRMQRNAAILERSRDLRGRPLRVLRVPLPQVIEREVLLTAEADTTRSEQWTADHFGPEERRRNGQRVTQVATASPLNFVVANGVVVVPGFPSQGAAWHERVRHLFEQAFPGRVVRFIDATGWHWVGAGPHCATLSEPA
jgi:agmatine deiminase